MTDEADLDAAPGEDNPWAPGGSMSRTPVPPRGEFFVPVSRRPVDPPAPPRGPEQTDHGSPGGSIPPSSRRWAVVAVVAVFALIVVAGAVIVGGDRDPEPAADPATTGAPSPTPQPTTTVTGPFDGEASVGPPTEVLVGGVDDDNDTGLVVDVGLPAAVDGTAPAEILVLGSGGRLSQLNTSSRLLRPLGVVPYDEPAITATNGAILAWEPGAADVSVVRRDEGTIQFELDAPVGWVVAEADDEFLLAPDSADDPWYELRLDPVVRTTPFRAVVDSPASVRPHPGGDVMLTGEDGTDLLASDGRVTISPGEVVATGRNHVLFEECEGACTFVIEDTRTGTRTEVSGIDSRGGLARGAVSPDGAVLARVETDGDAGLSVLRLVDIETGEAVEVQSPPTTFLPEPQWALDSSGLFGIDEGAVVFVDRATGLVTELSELAGVVGRDVRQIIVRPVPTYEPTEGSLVVTLTDLTGLDLIAVAASGDVIRIDVDGRTTNTYGGRPITTTPAVYVLPDDDGATVVSAGGAQAFRLDYGSEPAPDPGWVSQAHAFPGPTSDTLWFGASDFASNAVEFDLVDSSRVALGPRIDLRGAVAFGSDGTGRLIAYGPGGEYVVDPDGAARLTSGATIAVGATTAYAWECDEALSCAVVRIDRATGDRTPVTVEVLETASSSPWELTTYGSTVSPDGDVLMVQASRNALGWLMVDVAAGTVLEIPGPRTASPVVWSADSRYAAYVSGDVIRVYDRTAGELKDLGQLPPVVTFAVDPAVLE